METKKTDKIFTVKDVIYIVTLILGIAGSYFGQANKINMIEKQVTKNTGVLENNNLELISYKLDELKNSQDALVSTFNDFVKEYRSRNK